MCDWSSLKFMMCDWLICTHIYIYLYIIGDHYIYRFQSLLLVGIISARAHMAKRQSPPLYLAAEEGGLEEVKRLLALRGVDIHERGGEVSGLCTCL